MKGRMKLSQGSSGCLRRIGNILGRTLNAPHVLRANNPIIHGVLHQLGFPNVGITGGTVIPRAAAPGWRVIAS